MDRRVILKGYLIRREFCGIISHLERVAIRSYSHDFQLDYYLVSTFALPLRVSHISRDGEDPCRAMGD